MTSEIGALTYLLSSPFNADMELEINPFDKVLNVPWPLSDEAIVSDKDEKAPTMMKSPVRQGNYRRIWRTFPKGRAKYVASVNQVSIAPLRLVTADERGVRLPGQSSRPVVESETQLRALLGGLSGVDAVGAEARAAKLATRSLKKSTKMAALDLAISMVDLTTLEGADTPGE